MKTKVTLFALGLFLSLFSWGWVAGQTNSFVHFNKSFYVAGEIAWFKLYLSDGFPKEKSVISSSVYRSDGQLVEQFHLVNEGHSAAGYFKVPYDCISGVYHFIFNTFEKDTYRSIVLTEALVPIYNDLTGNTTIAQPTVPKPEEVDDYTASLSGLKIEFQSLGKGYEPRSEVEFSIRITNENGEPVPADLSISINDALLTEVNHPAFRTVQIGKTLPPESALATQIPISGRFRMENGQPLTSKGNMGIYIKTLRSFSYFQSANNGDYTFEIPLLYGPFDVHFRSFLPEDLLVSVDRNVGLAVESQPLVFPGKVLEYLQLSNQRKSIFNLFGETEHQLEPLEVEADANTPEFDASYRIDEYQAFPDIRTFVKELFMPVRVRLQKDGNYLVRIFNPAQNVRRFYSKAPLFLVDGKMTGDENFFATLDIQQIETIKLVWDQPKLRQYFGPLAYRGVIVIDSKDGNLELPEEDLQNLFRFNGLQLPIVYPVQVDPSARVLLRPALYWSPSHRTGKEGELRLQVPLSDDQSVFKVEVVAQDSVGKLRGFGRHHFTVEAFGEH